MFMVVIVTPETIPVNFFLINCCLVPRLWFVCGKDNQGGPWHLVTYLISKPYLSSIRVDPKTICFVFCFFFDNAQTTCYNPKAFRSEYSI